MGQWNAVIMKTCLENDLEKQLIIKIAMIDPLLKTSLKRVYNYQNLNLADESEV